jgi:DNA-binding NtrC family response regulator
MSIILLASETVPLKEISGIIKDAGAEVSMAFLNADFYTRPTSTDATIYFLIVEGQEFVSIGETTSRLRSVLDKEQTLILCMPLPVERSALLEMGADEIITPASKSVASIAERIIGKLISSGCLQPNRHGSLRGATREMCEVYRHIETLASLDDPLLILGETGTGKELVAHEVHRCSSRPDVYIAVNCAELNPELMGSELFGHEKGAFTNAIQSRRGLLAEAANGTLLLDEIGDLDLQAQAKLLRVLEEKRVRRIGSNRWEEVMARILLATNRDLDEDCQAGRFRMDLYERIRGFTIDLPPLRVRKADIPLLVEYFMSTFAEEHHCQLQLPSGAVDILFRYDWPGNVRELRATVRRSAAYADSDGTISSLILQESIRGRKTSQPTNMVAFNPGTDSWRDVQKNTQAAYFKALLVEAKGNRDIAIKLSGLSKSQFYEKLKESKIL